MRKTTLHDPACYLCQTRDGRHSAECELTPVNAVPLGQGQGWRAGVAAGRRVERHGRKTVLQEIAREQSSELDDIRGILRVAAGKSLEEFARDLMAELRFHRKQRKSGKR